MKKITFLFFFSILIQCAMYAQNQIIKTNPLGFAFGNFNAKYERALSESTSFLVGGNFYSRKIFGVKATGFGVDGEFRYYITNRKKPSPEGFYVGPGVSFDINNLGDVETGGVVNSRGSVTSLGIGATLGYQWVWDSGFALDLGLGPQYTFAVVKSDDVDSDVDFSGILPRLVFSIGYAF